MLHSRIKMDRFLTFLNLPSPICDSHFLKNFPPKHSAQPQDLRVAVSGEAELQVCSPLDFDFIIFIILFDHKLSAIIH